MITLLSYYESGWLEPRTDAFIWRQMCTAFSVDRMILVPKLMKKRTSVDQFATIEEALKTVQGKRLFMEPNGTSDLSVIRDYTDIVLIFGRAGINNMKHVTKNDRTVRIPTPNPSDLFAHQAAAIALAERVLQ